MSGHPVSQPFDNDVVVSAAWRTTVFLRVSILVILSLHLCLSDHILSKGESEVDSGPPAHPHTSLVYGV